MSDEIRPEVKEQMQGIGRMLGDCLPPTHGFALLVFDMETPEGFMNYISNAERETMLIAMREFIAHSEGRTPPASEREQ